MTFPIRKTLFMIFLACPLFVLANPYTNSITEEQKKSLVERLGEPIIRSYPELKHLNGKEVKELIKKNPKTVLVDVRNANERKISMIDGAICKKDFEKRKADLVKTPVIIYSSTGYRSAKFARTLKIEGFQVYNFIVSVLSWSHENVKFLKGKVEKKEI